MYPASALVFPPPCCCSLDIPTMAVLQPASPALLTTVLKHLGCSGAGCRSTISCLASRQKANSFLEHSLAMWQIAPESVHVEAGSPWCPTSTEASRSSSRHQKADLQSMHVSSISSKCQVRHQLCQPDGKQATAMPQLSLGDSRTLTSTQLPNCDCG